MARWRESWARAPAITRAPETRDLSRIDRGSGIYKFRCGKKDSTLSRACVQSSTSLSLFVNRSGETQQGLASTHGRIGTQTDACCTLRFIISVAVWRCCFMQYVMFPRARGYVFAYSSARSVNVVNYISRSSLACKHRAR